MGAVSTNGEGLDVIAEDSKGSGMVTADRGLETVITNIHEPSFDDGGKVSFETSALICLSIVHNPFFTHNQNVLDNCVPIWQNVDPPELKTSYPKLRVGHTATNK